MSEVIALPARPAPRGPRVVVSRDGGAAVLTHPKAGHVPAAIADATRQALEDEARQDAEAELKKILADMERLAARAVVIARGLNQQRNAARMVEFMAARVRADLGVF